MVTGAIFEPNAQCGSTSCCAESCAGCGRGVELGSAGLPGDLALASAFLGFSGWCALTATADSLFTLAKTAGLPSSTPVRTASLWFRPNPKENAAPRSARAIAATTKCRRFTSVSLNERFCADSVERYYPRTDKKSGPVRICVQGRPAAPSLRRAFGCERRARSLFLDRSRVSTKARMNRL
jgi:hypothetical protein